MRERKAKSGMESESTRGVPTGIDTTSTFVAGYDDLPK